MNYRPYSRHVICTYRYIKYKPYARVYYTTVNQIIFNKHYRTHLSVSTTPPFETHRHKSAAADACELLTFGERE